MTEIGKRSAERRFYELTGGKTEKTHCRFGDHARRIDGSTEYFDRVQERGETFHERKQF
jgi:hypothetical protein